MITVFNTAWVAIDMRAGVQPGDTVLVTGAAGGVGSAAIQLCKARGGDGAGRGFKPGKGGFRAGLRRRRGDRHQRPGCRRPQDAPESPGRGGPTGAAEGRGCDAVIEMVGGRPVRGQPARAALRRQAGDRRLCRRHPSPAAKANYLLFNNLTVMERAARYPVRHGLRGYGKGRERLARPARRRQARLPDYRALSAGPFRRGVRRDHRPQRHGQDRPSTRRRRSGGRRGPDQAASA